jgi:lipoprotein-anchoring transpeptidase ErfK/SrfK
MYKDRKLKKLQMAIAACCMIGPVLFTVSCSTTGGGGMSRPSNYQNYAGTTATTNPNGFPTERVATGKPVFIYNPNSLYWAVYDSQGQLMKTGHGSSGREYCPDLGHGCKTPSGTYHIYSKAGPGYKSKIFPMPRGGAPMPYAMFFSGGYAVHGSYDIPNFNASHGCVRISAPDAAWLNQDVLTNGSTVIVYPY